MLRFHLGAQLWRLWASEVAEGGEGGDVDFETLALTAAVASKCHPEKVLHIHSSPPPFSKFFEAPLGTPWLVL